MMTSVFRPPVMRRNHHPAQAALAALLCLGSPEPAAASCTAPVRLAHELGGTIACADGAPLHAIAWLLSDPPAAHTDGLDLVCEAQEETACSAASGVIGDGRVTLRGDWSDPVVVGCPVTADGPQRIVVALAERSSTAGSSLLLSLGGYDPEFSTPYLAEAAHTYDPVTLEILPLACRAAVRATAIENYSITLEFAPPRVFSDCDSGTVGEFLGLCRDGFLPGLSHGPLYEKVRPCGEPVDLRRDGWTPTGLSPDVAGRVTTPTSSLPPEECRLLGATTMIDGIESPVITAYVDDLDCRSRDGDPSWSCERDCDALFCMADCDDHDPRRYPGNPEICDGIDNDCDGSIDEEIDADGDNVVDCIDNCPLVYNPTQLDIDFDGFGDACDNCPTIPNPTQDPCVCTGCNQAFLTISFESPLGRGSGTVSWSTNHEFDIAGFNVVVFNNKGDRIQQNDTLIPCQECITGLGAFYTYIIPKHKSGRNIYVEVVRRNGLVLTFGPAIRQ